MEHPELVVAAEEAIRKVFEDISVEWQATLESMQGLADCAQGYVDTLEEEHADEL